MTSKENINFIFQLNNKNRSGNFFVLFIIGGILLSGSAITCVALGWYLLLIIISVLSIAYIIIMNYLKPSFVEFLVTESQLQLNFYSVASTFRSYQSLEIPLNQLADYSIDHKLWGLRTRLTITIHSKYGIADYPPVSLSLLNKQEMAQIILILNKILESKAKV